MDALQILRAVFGLAIVVGLIFGLAYVLRRYAPQLMEKLQAPRGQKRLEVVETLVLDPVRRLVLVKLDGKERLILLGEGRELNEPGPRTMPVKAVPVQDVPVQRTTPPPPAPDRAPDRSKVAVLPKRPPLQGNPRPPARPPVNPNSDPNDDLF